MQAAAVQSKAPSFSVPALITLQTLPLWSRSSCTESAHSPLAVQAIGSVSPTGQRSPSAGAVSVSSQAGGVVGQVIVKTARLWVARPFSVAVTRTR